jgi:hypothetical protein
VSGPFQALSALRHWQNAGVADGLEEFQEKRSRMFGIAYRMLGSVTRTYCGRPSPTATGRSPLATVLITTLAVSVLLPLALIGVELSASPKAVGRRP